MAEHLVGGGTVLIGRGLGPGDVITGERAVVAVVAQPPTARRARDLVRALGRFGMRAEARVVPDGEAAKTLEVAADLYTWLAGLGVTRGDVLVAVGGGALTDVAGFVAATYLRGIDTVYVPTTLLGALDAAIGGKTGVNLGAKNLVGTFRHPARVVVDVDVLDRLPGHLKQEGAAEALKAGLIGDPVLFEILEEEGLAADLEQVVDRAVAVKAGIVGRDFLEGGERAHLNYGHTIGHAVEVAAGISHGRAVAVGMIAAGRASAIEAGFDEEDRQRAAVAGLGLPVAAASASRGEVWDLLAFDKKRDAGGLRMVLLEAIAVPRVGHVGSATVEAALAAVEVR